MQAGSKQRSSVIAICSAPGAWLVLWCVVLGHTRVGTGGAPFVLDLSGSGRPLPTLRIKTPGRMSRPGAILEFVFPNSHI
jgi:hypothetical protein